ncbi:MAG TPA: amino acid adenylation domain-containing protein, partial [Steroidobacteraceae bacterium]
MDGHSGRGSTVMTPEMSPLPEVGVDQFRLIAQAVPQGADNIQDIYPLTPVQAGILFHHIMDGADDKYVVLSLMEFVSRAHLETFIEATRYAMARHDTLRTAFFWEGLPRPVQVVLREAALPVCELALDGERGALEQLRERMTPQWQSLDVHQAPLLRLQIAKHPQGAQWYALLAIHHLICDGLSLEVLITEIRAHIEGRARDLPEPMQYRMHVAQVLEHARTRDAETFFRKKLGGIDEPTAPFGLLDLHADGNRLVVARQMLEGIPAQRTRAVARRHCVSPATLFHVAWALVVAHTSGRSNVVFGTVFLGRVHLSRGMRQAVGPFLNTVPLCLQLQDAAVKELVLTAQKELSELFRYQQISLAVSQRCSAINGSAPLFTSLLNYRQGARNPGNRPDSTVHGYRDLESRTWTNYPLTLSIDDLGTNFKLTVQADARVDPQRIVDYVSTALGSLVEALEQAPQSPALSLSVLPETERHQVIEQFNTTPASYPNELVHELFEQQVERTPHGVAVVYEGQALTYAELNARANQLAWYLRERQVGPDQRVGIFVERSLEMVVGLLGILKAGGAYVPLDPGYPLERLQYILSDAAPRLLLTQTHLAARLRHTRTPAIELDGQWHEIARQPCGNLDSRTLGLRPDHLSYVIYTSGSTGQPKGVMVEHAGFANYLQWALSTYALEAGAAVPVSSPLAFDATITSLYSPLLSGRTAVLLLSGQELEGLERLLLQPQRWSLVKISPAHLHVLGQRLQPLQPPCTVGAFVIGGEALAPSTVRLWRSIWPQTRLINEYGPTETVVGCCVYEVPQDWVRASSVPIGCPIANTQLYILDAQHHPVPIGVTGEIYIGGAGVARGYLNQPQLTAQRFIPNPFSRDPRARLYRTGDLGRWRPEGVIEYLSRNDHQVKIRGFRIELGEIEAQLLRHSQVRQAVVLVREDGPGEKYLVAYVVLEDAAANDTTIAQSLRAHLEPVLPEYMMPRAVVRLESFPLTSNGKLHRRALPAPELGTSTSRRYEAPQGEIEEILAGIWRELLGSERIGRADNFFELGGHSLLGMKLLAHVAMKLNMHLPAASIFRYPTIREMARILEQPRLTGSRNHVGDKGGSSPVAKQTPLRPRLSAELVPLSFSQQYLWDLLHLEHRPSIRSVAAAVRLHGPLDIDTLQQSVAKLVRRHESLRTRIALVDGALRQHVDDAEHASLEVLDLTSLPRGARELETRRLVEQLVHEPIDLRVGPLFAARLLRLAGHDHVLVLATEHLISDAVSIGLLWRDLFSLYAQSLRGSPPALADLPIQFPDYAVWQRRTHAAWMQTHGAYWQQTFAGAERVRLFAFEKVPRASEMRYARAPIRFGADLSRALLEMSRREGTTLVMSVLTAFVALVMRTCNITTLVFPFTSS